MLWSHPFLGSSVRCAFRSMSCLLQHHKVIVSEASIGSMVTVHVIAVFPCYFCQFQGLFIWSSITLGHLVSGNSSNAFCRSKFLNVMRRYYLFLDMGNSWWDLEAMNTYFCHFLNLSRGLQLPCRSKHLLQKCRIWNCFPSHKGISRWCLNGHECSFIAAWH